MGDDAYKQAGVDIAAGNKATALMRDAVRATYTDAVLSDIGSFGGLFSADALKSMAAPVLVASTDGVGTKSIVAARMNRWDTIGQDLVYHCVNDIMVQGARPLFFLDYVASSELNPEQIAAVVAGCAVACKAVGAVLLGGETAEMPGVYQPGEIDLVGTIIGVVDRDRVLDGSRVQAGDAILALPSSGLHTNGYSLARKALAHINWSQPHSLLRESVGEALLRVHRCYIHEIDALEQSGVDIRALAHITGGGVYDNLPRVLPDGLGAVIRRGTWEVPPIFGLIQSLADVSERDMFHTFNMGLGMLVVVAPDHVERAAAVSGGQIVGEIASQTAEDRVQIVDG